VKNNSALAILIMAVLLVSSNNVARADATEKIEAIHFMNATKVRPGGRVTFVPTPIILLKDGVVCKCISIPPEELRIDELRRSKPYQVGRWRKAGDQYQVRWPKSKNWRNITWQKKPARTLGNKWRGRGLYTAVDSASYGSAGMGDYGAYYFSTTFEFSADGRFAKGGRLEMASEGDGVSATGSRDRKIRTGTYDVKDYVMTIKYDDGEIRRYTAITIDGGMIWLNGVGYAAE